MFTSTVHLALVAMLLLLPLVPFSTQSTYQATDTTLNYVPDFKADTERLMTYAGRNEQCSPNCVFREKGDKEKVIAYLANKGPCLKNDRDKNDWRVFYMVDSKTWKNSKKSQWRYWTSDKLLQLNPWASRVGIIDGDPPVIALCFSSSLTKSQAMSTWVWLKK